MCTEPKKPVVRVIPVVHYLDQIVPDSPMQPQYRYFLIGFSTHEKCGSGYISGHTWFGCHDFPNKNFIDSIVYASLPLKRKCYLSVLLTLIYEFKNQADFISFKTGYAGDAIPKRQAGCCGVDREKPVYMNHFSLTPGLLDVDSGSYRYSLYDTNAFKVDTGLIKKYLLHE